jgi:hypothetical protein
MFKKFPNLNNWTKWSEIDDSFELLSSNLYFKNFRRCKVLIETMDYQNLDAKKYSQLLRSSGILEPKFGRPIKPFFLRNSLNSGHQYRHLLEYTKTTGISINSYQRIIEFGGGYGCMRWLVGEHGYKGKYEIIDNPGISKLQIRYLESSLNRADFEKTNWNPTINHLLPSLNSEDLFIGLWSVSETPTEMMLEIIDLLDQNSCHLLLAFQHKFTGRDNKSYFDKYLNNSFRIQIAYPANNFHSTYIFR